MQADEFDYIASVLKQKSGMYLSPDKTYLLESRLQPIARASGLENVSELIKKMRSTADRQLIHDVTQAMTTNETMFFRDNKPFEKLTGVILPKLAALDPARKHLRIWSAACSAGQEPYTIAMVLTEHLAKMPGYSFEIVATDLCEKVLAKAKDGLYSQFEVQRGMPIQMLLKYFQQAPENQWQVKDMVKSMIRFDSHNLLDDASRFGTFDIIFCRNVLIYFDETTKGHVLSRLAGVMRPPGFLTLGSAETVIGISTRYKQMEEERSVYQLA